MVCAKERSSGDSALSSDDRFCVVVDVWAASPHRVAFREMAFGHEKSRLPTQAATFQTMVGMTGFEPATSSSRTMRATKLRHIPTTGVLYYGMRKKARGKLSAAMRQQSNDFSARVMNAAQRRHVGLDLWLHVRAGGKVTAL